MVWATGTQLQSGKYIIEAILGQGGFGITYKALHVPLEHQVVIKTPNEHLKHDPEYDKYVTRFIQEGQILARLSRDPHPHIVGVRDLFTEDETHCLVMDFVPGENLFELVKRRGAVPEAEAVRYVRQIGEALTVVHQAGLVHRDAHPGNIMLRNNGRAVLIDFGIAKELIPSTQSSTGYAGNQGFAPYEQMYRGSREPNVDVYCLAATLYYAVTGQRPPSSLDRKLDNAPLNPPRQLKPSISNRLSEGIITGMALEAKDRPQSMLEWLRLLESPTILTPPPSVEPIQPRETIHSSSQVHFTPPLHQQEQQETIDSSTPPRSSGDEPSVKVTQPRFRWWSPSGLVALTVVLVGVFSIPVALMRFTEQVTHAKQAEARNNVATMNRAQQAYFLEFSEFTNSLADLGVGIKEQTENYSYSIRKSTSSSSAVTINGKKYNQVVSHYGISRQDNLKSYVGHVGLVEMPDTNELLTVAIACESDSPGTTRPADPIYQNNELTCGAGTHRL